MLDKPKKSAEVDVCALLRAHGVSPTVQRTTVARALFRRRGHLSAEDLFRLVNEEDGSARVSKATVYNTLNLLVSSGVVRAVIAGSNRVMYDANVSAHHHFYDVVTGELTDIDVREVHLSKLPLLPEGAVLQGVDIIFRIRGVAKI